MNTYNITFYDLITAALGKNDNRTIQGFLDDFLATKYNGLQLDGFDFAPDMQLDFIYEQLIKSIDITPMAQYVDVDSPATPRGTKGFETHTGKIPRMKLVEYFNEDKVRKMRIAEQRFGANSGRIHEMALRDLFITTDKLIGGHTNSLTYQRHRMVSKGVLEINNINNPNGITGITLPAYIPSDNVTTLKGEKRWWKSYDSATGEYSSEGANCDPIKDLQDRVRYARKRYGLTKMHFEVDYDFAMQMVRHSKIVAALAMHYFTVGITEDWVKNKVNVDFTFEKKLQGLGEIVGASFKVVDAMSAVERWDASKEELVTETMRPFEDNTIVLVPDGKLGEVLTVEPIPVGEGTYASFYGGRLLMTVGYDAVKKCQSFNTEMTSLVVPDKPQYMWYLHPYGTV